MANTNKLNAYAMHSAKLLIEDPDNPGAFKIIKGISDLQTTIEGNTYEYNPADLDGWVARFMTGKSANISVEIAINTECEGQAILNSMAFKTGSDSESIVKLELPAALQQLTMNVIVSVSQPFGGASTDISIMTVEFLSTGKPVFEALAGTPVITSMSTYGAPTSDRIIINVDCDYKNTSVHTAQISGGGQAPKQILEGNHNYTFDNLTPSTTYVFTSTLLWSGTQVQTSHTESTIGTTQQNVETKSSKKSNK